MEQEKTIKEILEKNTLVPQQSLQKASIQENFDDVLTTEEKQEAIRAAAEKKLAKQREIEYWEKVKNPPKPKAISSEEFYDVTIGRAFMEFGVNEKREPKFILSDAEKSIYKMMAMYFTRNPDFEKLGEDFSLKKGLMLFGNIGCGKTTAMRLFAANPYQSYSIVSCRKVQAEYAAKGFSEINRYSDWIPSVVPATSYGQRQLGILFDDLGTESTAKNFGNELNVMADIIQNRYDNENASFFRTHFTTNINVVHIENFYGSRVRSRLREMVNMIIFPEDSKDKRK